MYKLKLIKLGRIISTQKSQIKRKNTTRDKTGKLY